MAVQLVELSFSQNSFTSIYTLLEIQQMDIIWYNLRPLLISVSILGENISTG